MIEKFIVKKLKDKMGIPVFAEVPKTITYPFLVVQKTGGSVKNLIWHSTLAIQSYNTSLLKAGELNEQVIDAMYELEALNELCSVSLNSNYPFNDTTNKRYRYQAVFDIYHYGGLD